LHELYKRKHPKHRITNHKKIYFNSTKDILCHNCEKKLINQYIFSSPNAKYRCLDCAVKTSLIDKIPDEIMEAMD